MVKRILSLDGGGVKCIIALQLLKHIEETYNIVLHENFDMFAGTSSGGLIVTLIIYKKMSAGEILEKIYTLENLKNIMYQSYYDKWFGILQYKPKYSDKGKQELINKFLIDDIVINNDDTNIVNLKEIIKKELKEEIKREICSELNINNVEIKLNNSVEIKLNNSVETKLNSVLKDQNNKHTLYCVDKPLLLTAYDPYMKKPIFFRNYFNMPNYYLVEICNATSAAPTYFPAAKVTNIDNNVVNWYIDGGVCNNNPTHSAYIDIKKLYPNEKIEVLSIGTGISKSNFDPNKDSNIGGIEWILQDNIIDTILDGNQIMSHVCTEELTKENNDKYLRINKYLKLSSYKIDDISDTNYELMLKEGSKWFEKSETELHNFFTKN